MPACATTSYLCRCFFNGSHETEPVLPAHSSLFSLLPCQHAAARNQARRRAAAVKDSGFRTHHECRQNRLGQQAPRCAAASTSLLGLKRGLRVRGGVTPRTTQPLTNASKARQQCARTTTLGRTFPLPRQISNSREIISTIIFFSSVFSAMYSDTHTHNARRGATQSLVVAPTVKEEEESPAAKPVHTHTHTHSPWPRPEKGEQRARAVPPCRRARRSARLWP